MDRTAELAARTVTLVAILVSLVVVPVGLGYYFVVHGLPADSTATVNVVGAIAMLPGILMGTTALWISAHEWL